MTAQKHTPGEWHWVIHDHSCASLGVGDDPGLGTPLVMSVSPCRSCAERANPKEWEWGRCCTPTEADARLIAAAPEMLEALQDMLAAYSEPDQQLCCDGRDCGCMGSTVRQEAEHYARTAIAKATGQ